MAALFAYAHISRWPAARAVFSSSRTRHDIGIGIDEWQHNARHHPHRTPDVPGGSHHRQRRRSYGSRERNNNGSRSDAQRSRPEIPHLQQQQQHNEADEWLVSGASVVAPSLGESRRIFDTGCVLQSAETRRTWTAMAERLVMRWIMDEIVDLISVTL